MRVFNDQWKQIALHSKVEPGRFRTDAAHILPGKVTTVECGTDALMRKIAAIGPNSKAWSQLVIASRGVQDVRVLLGLKALAGKHTSAELERACGTAVACWAARNSARNGVESIQFSGIGGIGSPKNTVIRAPSFIISARFYAGACSAMLLSTSVTTSNPSASSSRRMFRAGRRRTTVS